MDKQQAKKLYRFQETTINVGSNKPMIIEKAASIVFEQHQPVPIKKRDFIELN